MRPSSLFLQQNRTNPTFSLLHRWFSLNEIFTHWNLIRSQSSVPLHQNWVHILVPQRSRKRKKMESRNSVVFEQYERCLEFTDTGVGQHVHLNVETGFKLSGIVSSAIIVGEQVLCDTHPPTPQRRLRLSSELSGNWANIVTIVTIVHQLD